MRPLVEHALGLGLAAIRHVPVTLMAVITSTTPLWTYGLALALGRETYSALRLAALVTGLCSSLAIILTRPGISLQSMDGWLLVSLAVPLLYAGYNNFASAAWPQRMAPLTAGIVESFASALIAVPFALWLTGDSAVSEHAIGYLLLAATVGMWILERVCFFSMMKQLGPVSTVQAVYVSTPASVVIGLVAFQEQADAWLWLSLGLLMAGLWLNNRAVRLQTARAPNPATA